MSVRLEIGKIYCYHNENIKFFFICLEEYRELSLIIGTCGLYPLGSISHLDLKALEKESYITEIKSEE